MRPITLAEAESKMGNDPDETCSGSIRSQHARPSKPMQRAASSSNRAGPGGRHPTSTAELSIRPKTFPASDAAPLLLPQQATLGPPYYQNATRPVLGPSYLQHGERISSRTISSRVECRSKTEPECPRTKKTRGGMDARRTDVIVPGQGTWIHDRQKRKQRHQ